MLPLDLADGGPDFPMTVFVYVNTSKQVGDAEHVKVFATTDSAETWFEERDRKVRRLSMMFWSECRRRL